MVSRREGATWRSHRRPWPVSVSSKCTRWPIPSGSGPLGQHGTTGKPDGGVRSSIVLASSSTAMVAMLRSAGFALDVHTLCQVPETTDGESHDDGVAGLRSVHQFLPALVFMERLLITPEKLIKLWGVKPSVSTWQMRLRLYEFSQLDRPDCHGGYMLLDLDGLVWTPRNPACGDCLIRRGCSTGAKSDRVPDLNGGLAS